MLLHNRNLKEIHWDFTEKIMSPIFGSTEKIFSEKVGNFFEHQNRCKNCSRIDCAHQNLYIRTLDRYNYNRKPRFLHHNSWFSNKYVHISPSIYITIHPCNNFPSDFDIFWNVDVRDLHGESQFRVHVLMSCKKAVFSRRYHALGHWISIQYCNNHIQFCNMIRTSVAFEVKASSRTCLKRFCYGNSHDFNS